VSDIAPWFEPGSGFYRMGQWAPGSLADKEARPKAAYRCVIYRMRRPSTGAKLPASDVLLQQPISAGIICTDHYTHPRWHAEALALPDLDHQLLQMHEVRLVRVRGGFRQYQGIEYGEKALTSWPQTWFCAPNETAGRAVLDQMMVSG
jgi:hypothetical protein